MVILIVSGGFYRIVSGYLPDRLEAVQADALTLQDLPGYLQENNPAVDGVLLTDEAFSGSQEPDLGHFNAALNWFSDRRGRRSRSFYSPETRSGPSNWSRSCRSTPACGSSFATNRESRSA